MRLLVLLACLASIPSAAHASDVDEAKAHYQKGLAAFGLAKYAEAAVEYEKAFELKPDPALLYNAAQAQRMAGNKQRALVLYQNYLRLFGTVSNKAEVQRHIETLKRIIDEEQRAQTAPPTEPQPISGEKRAPSAPAASAPPPAAPPPAASPASEPAPAAVEPAPAALTAAPPPPEKKRVKPWVIGVSVAAAVVAVGLGVGLGVGLSQSPGDPAAPLGTARVH